MDGKVVQSGTVQVRGCFWGSKSGTQLVQSGTKWYKGQVREGFEDESH